MPNTTQSPIAKAAMAAADGDGVGVSNAIIVHVTNQHQIFARLNAKVDPKIEELRKKEVASRIQAQQEKSQAREAELVGCIRHLLQDLD